MTGENPGRLHGAPGGEWGPPAPGGGWGPPTPGGGGGPPTPVRDKNTIAFVSGVLSTAGASVLYLSNGILAPLSLALGVAATICAWIGRQRIKRGESNADPMWSDVGLAVGGACTGLSLIAFVVIIVLLLVD